MLYLLYGENEIEIDKFINNLMKENNIDNKITYNYKETEITDIIEEASYTDLFGNKKIVILNDAYFLTGKGSLENETLDKYIENPNQNTIFIFKVITDKLDERKKIVKLLNEKCIVKEFKLLDNKNIDSYITSYFKDKRYSINRDAINKIIDNLSGNTKVIDKELEKLILYKIDEKIITIDDVNLVITKYDSDLIFKLVDAVLKSDKKNVFNIYKKLVNDREEPSVILALLESQFRLLLNVKILSSKGLDKIKISSYLKEHPYRVELSLKNSYNMSKEKITDILYKLSLIDIDIKTGENDKYKSLENFLLEI